MSPASALFDNPSDDTRRCWLSPVSALLRLRRSDGDPNACRPENATNSWPGR